RARRLPLRTVRFPPPGQTFPAASDGKALCASPSTVLMPTVISMAMPARGNGMGHLRAFRAAAIGKPLANKARLRRLIFASVTLFAATVCGSASRAQSGPFAGMAGNWAGGGTVTLDDGSTE